MRSLDDQGRVERLAPMVNLDWFLSSVGPWHGEDTSRETSDPETPSPRTMCWRGTRTRWRRSSVYRGVDEIEGDIWEERRHESSHSSSAGEVGDQKAGPKLLFVALQRRKERTYSTWIGQESRDDSRSPQLPERLAWIEGRVCETERRSLITFDRWHCGRAAAYQNAHSLTAEQSNMGPQQRRRSNPQFVLILRWHRRIEKDPWTNPASRADEQGVAVRNRVVFGVKDHIDWRPLRSSRDWLLTTDCTSVSDESCVLVALAPDIHHVTAA